MSFPPVHPRDLAIASSTRIVDNKTFIVAILGKQYNYSYYISFYILVLNNLHRRLHCWSSETEYENYTFVRLKFVFQECVVLRRKRSYWKWKALVLSSKGTRCTCLLATVLVVMRLCKFTSTQHPLCSSMPYVNLHVGWAVTCNGSVNTPR